MKAGLKCFNNVLNDFLNDKLLSFLCTQVQLKLFCYIVHCSQNCSFMILNYSSVPLRKHSRYSRSASEAIDFKTVKSMSERNESHGRHPQCHVKPFLKMLAVCFDEIEGGYLW